MMSPAHDRDDLSVIERLVNEWQAGTISIADRERLNRLLLESRAGRELFLQYAHLESGLHWMFAGKKQAASLIAGPANGAARPIALIAQQHLGLGEDERFVHVFTLCKGNEGHSQAWLQLYPRIRAIALLGHATNGGAAASLDRVITEVSTAYSPKLSTEEFWTRAAEATQRFVIATGARLTETLGAIWDHAAGAILRASPTASGIDVVAMAEVIDECVPHRLSADSLRVLYLRYLHNLPPRQIAVHLERTEKNVRLLLAKVRVHLARSSLGIRDEGGSDNETRALLVLNVLLDGGGMADSGSGELGHWLSADDRNPRLAAGVTMVHDYLGRQLSLLQLFEELQVRKDESIVHAIEQSLQDIEILSPRERNELAKPPAAVVGNKRWMAWLGVAAALLVAVGMAVWGSWPDAPSLDHGAGQVAGIANESGASRSRSESEVRPQLPPVVAVVSEALDLVDDGTARLSTGAFIRKGDQLAFTNGVVQMSTTAGCTLVLEGPVEAVLRDANWVYVRRGKVLGLNEESGTSLTVESPTSRIVDVGTEFGVAVNAEQATAVSVYQGEVNFEPGSSEEIRAQTESVSLKAGWEAKIDGRGDRVGKPEPLAHEREFVRVDEVRMRKDAGSPGSAAATAIAYFRLLRVPGLLAYQGFDSASSAQQYSLGFKNPPIRGSGGGEFGPNLAKRPPIPGSDGALAVSVNGPYFLDLDTSPRSLVYKLGLVGEDGQIGQREGDLWLAWRTQAIVPNAERFSWAGLSLMFGDERSEQEPLFIGQPATLPNYGFHVFSGIGDARDFYREFDQDPKTDGIQALVPDDRLHFWIMHLAMNARSANVQMWCDVPAEQVATTPPQASCSIDDFRFDRIRLEAKPTGDGGDWRFDDLLIAASSEAVANVMELLNRGTELPP